MRNARIFLTKSNQEFDIVSIQSTRFANTCILRGTESFATITSIWTIERSISPAYLSTIHRSYDSVLGDVWRSYQPLERHRDTLDRYPSEKCRWDRFQILRGLFLTVFINTPSAFPGPRKERYPGKLGAKRRSTRESLRPFVKEEMTIVLSLKDYRCYRRVLSTKTHEFAANLSSREHFPFFLQSARPCIRDDYFSLSRSRGLLRRMYF